MAKHLGVEYIYREEVVASLNLEAIKLPADLMGRLHEAFEMGLVTELDRLVDEVRGLGEDTGPFADHLNQLCRRLDMEGIQMLLEDLSE